MTSTVVEKLKQRGFVVLASIATKFETSVKVIQDAGFADSLPNNINNAKQVFGKAVKVVKRNFGIEDVNLVNLDRRFKDLANDCRIAIARPRSDGTRYWTEDFCTCIFDGTRVSVESIDGDASEVAEFNRQLQEEFGRQLREGTVNADQFRGIFSGVMKSMRAFSLRCTQSEFGNKKNGGVYFIDEMFSERLEQLAVLFRTVGNDVGLTAFPIYNDPQSASLLQNSAESDIKAALKDLCERLDADIGKGMTPNTLENRRQKAADLSDRVRVHATSLADKAAEYKEIAVRAEQIISAKLAVATGKVVRPFSLSEELGLIDDRMSGREVPEAPAPVAVEPEVAETASLPAESIFGEEAPKPLPEPEAAPVAGTAPSIWDFE